MAHVTSPAFRTILRLHRAHRPVVCVAELAFAFFVLAWLMTTLVPAHASAYARSEPFSALTSVAAYHRESASDVSEFDSPHVPIPVDAHATEHCVLHCAPALGVLVLALWASLVVAHALALPAHILGMRLNHPPLTPPPQLLLG